MERTIPKKNTPCTTEGKFSFVIGTKIGPTDTTKSSKSIIIWCDIKKMFCGSGEIKDLASWKQSYKKSGYKKCFIPKFERHRGIGK
jgi:hypothetical protein